jgi:UDP-galactopyranose mutase
VVTGKARFMVYEMCFICSLDCFYEYFMGKLHYESVHVRSGSTRIGRFLLELIARVELLTDFSCIVYGEAKNWFQNGGWWTFLQQQL